RAPALHAARPISQAEPGRQRLGGRIGAPQVAAVQRAERLPRSADARRQLRGLLTPGGIEFYILPALQAALAVPRSFAVADKPDFSHAYSIKGWGIGGGAPEFPDFLHERD